MQRIGKTILVWVVVLFTAVDPASAGWLLGRRMCCPPPCCYTECCVPTCSPCETDCCDGASSLPTPAGDGSSKEPTLAPAPAPTESAPTPAPAQQPAPSRRPLPAHPAPEPPPAPAPAPSDDVPFAEPPAADAPPTPPADTPAEEMPEEPSRQSKPDEAVEDLFKDSDAKGAEPTEPAKEPADKSDSVDDLFKETSTSSPATHVAAQATTDPALEKELEDLFADPDTSVTAVEHTNPMRLWTDNTGKYKVMARLVEVRETSVRLLKDTGRYTTVPFERLSRDDLAFVRQNETTVIAGNF